MAFSWITSLLRRRGLSLFFALVFVGIYAAPALSQQSAAPAPGQRRLVGYFPQWGLYNETPYTVKALAANGGAGMLDQINYAQAFVTGGHCSVADPNADLNYTFTAENSVDGSADKPGQLLRGNFHQLQELKRTHPRLRILISLEGRARDFAADAEPEARAAFVASCVDLFLRGNIAPGISAAGLFDGIDLDWEFPDGPASANYVPLLEEFRRQMDALRPGMLLTVALGPSPRMYGDADLGRMASLVDQAGLMTYDFNGPWSPTTGLIAPLASPGGGSVERSVTSWLRAGIPAQKLLVGIPFYGYGWRSVPDVNHGFGQDGKPIHGDRPYRFIEGLVSSPAAAATAPANAVYDTTSPRSTVPLSNSSPSLVSTPAPVQNAGNARTLPVVYRDPVSQAPWLFDGDSFWTYEDETSVRSKASYVAKQQLGGFMIWELGEDTATATLLKAAHSALLAPVPQSSPDAQVSENPTVTDAAE